MMRADILRVVGAFMDDSQTVPCRIIGSAYKSMCDGVTHHSLSDVPRPCRA